MQTLFITGLQAYCEETSPASLSNDYCAKGDKILNYYEALEDKSNPDRYLNAAKYFYYQANRISLSNQNAFVGRARIALLQGRIRDAKNNLMIALNVNEMNPKVNFYLGEAFYEDGEFTQAIDFYYFAYSHGYKNDFRTNMKLGKCYEKLDDTEKARYHYTNALKINPSSEEAQKRLTGLDSIKTIKSKQNNNNYHVTEEDMRNLYH